MAWFCAMAVSVRVIFSAKAVWAAAKDADVVEKVWTTSIIVRKSLVDMEICCGGGVDVLGPIDVVGDGGAKDVGYVGNGAMTTGAANGAIWGSFVSFVGWPTAMSSTMSLGGGCSARGRSCHLSTIRMASQSQ